MSFSVILNKKEFKKILSTECKVENNFMNFSTTLQVKNGIILKSKAQKNENNLKNYFYVFIFITFNKSTFNKYFTFDKKL